MRMNGLSKFQMARQYFILINCFLFFFILLGQVCYSTDKQKSLYPVLFLNDYPEDIYVVRGQPVIIPIFLASGDYTSVPLEFFVWRQELDTNRILCFTESGWKEVNSIDVCQPLTIFQALPSYYRLAWTAFDQSELDSLHNFNLTLCLDPKINTYPEEDRSRMFCAECKVIIEDPPPAPKVDEDNMGTSQVGQDENRPDSGSGVPPSNSNSLSFLDIITSGAVSNSGNNHDDKWEIYGDTTQHSSSTCEPSSIHSRPDKLSFYAYVGEAKTGKKTISIKDDCGKSVAAHVTSKPDYVTVTPLSTASCQFSVQVSLSGVDGTGTLGDIHIMVDSGYNKGISIPVEITITDAPQVADNKIPTLEIGEIYFYDIKAREARFFKVRAGGDDIAAIQFSHTPASDQPHTVHLVVKRDAPPTVTEFNKALESSRIADGPIYYRYGEGAGGELVPITDGLDHVHWYYIMLFNNGERNVYEQRLIVSINKKR